MRRGRMIMIKQKIVYQVEPEDLTMDFKNEDIPIPNYISRNESTWEHCSNDGCDVVEELLSKPELDIHISYDDTKLTLEVKREEINLRTRYRLMERVTAFIEGEINLIQNGY
jgi:hypothetical protein